MGLRYTLLNGLLVLKSSVTTTALEMFFPVTKKLATARILTMTHGENAPMKEASVHVLQVDLSAMEVEYGVIPK